MNYLPNNEMSQDIPSCLLNLQRREAFGCQENEQENVKERERENIEREEKSKSGRGT